MKLATQIVEKPWGRCDIPAAFGDFGERQIGEIWYDAPGGEPLPLLVKWLFTSEKLSIQVHPDDVQAQARGLPSGKEECWYIVDAEPGAVLGMGTKMRLSANELRAASLSGEIESLMDWKPVKAGDYFYIPAGTVHAIGAGITLVEVQQNADITYRLYDYQRLDNGKLRELHLDDGVSVADAKPYNQAFSGCANGNMQLVDSAHFRLWLAQNNAGIAAVAKGNSIWVTPVAGQAFVDGEPVNVGECHLAEADATIEAGSNSRILLASI